MSHKTAGFRLTIEQFDKLDSMASNVGVTRNHLVGLLVDNAKIARVEKFEPVAYLPVKTNNHNVQVLAGKDVVIAGV